jgi:hypothetical protein
VLKRFLAFGGDNYYPGGGWDDFIGDYDTIEQAEAAGKHCDWHHVVDSEIGKNLQDIPESET